VMWARVPISIAVWGVPVLFLILQIRQQKIVWEALSVPAIVVITTYGICHLFFSGYNLEPGAVESGVELKLKNLLTDRLEKYV